MEEQWPSKPKVVGSIPASGTILRKKNKEDNKITIIETTNMGD